jgi:hypothetical protein
VKLETITAARPFLPEGPESTLTVNLVKRFRRAGRRDPEVRLAVLGTLRAHSANGAEAPLAAGSVMFAAVSVVVAVSVTSVPGWVSWLLPIVYAAATIPFAVWILRVSLAAHARRVMATTWLGAYEDALGRSR